VTKLSVNVNKIATLRNTRANAIPDLAQLAALALAAGANGITVHPRPDERHIRAGDVPELAAVVARFPGAELNIEGNPFHGLLEHCERARPKQATLVPDAREALTSNHGWNLAEMARDQSTALAAAVARLRDLGCRVSLFVDPIPELMPLAKALGADRVELYTEPYAASAAEGRATAGLAAYVAAAAAAHDQGLGINAGHDLNLDNLEAFINGVRPLDEVSIGHALIADALAIGLPSAVRSYLAICTAPRD
jgi:pyridoxine 5-phosphate synthase